MSARGRAIFERNVDACETAKYPTCQCACDGALHGAKHSKKWRQETWGAKLERERQELRAEGVGAHGGDE